MGAGRVWAVNWTGNGGTQDMHVQGMDCCSSKALLEFAKLYGARALFGYFITLLVTKIVKFLGKIDDHPE